MAPSGEASIFSREVQRFKVLKPVVKEGWTVKSSMNKQEKINAKFATLVTTTEVIRYCQQKHINQLRFLFLDLNNLLCVLRKVGYYSIGSLYEPMSCNWFSLIFYLMHKDILAAVVWRDKSPSLGYVKPLAFALLKCNCWNKIGTITVTHNTHNKYDDKQSNAICVPIPAKGT